MNDPKTLNNVTFKPWGSIGFNIESMLGIMPDSLPQPDAGDWEIKSRCITAKSLITLGGKKTDDNMKLYNQVYNKIKNILFVEYQQNNDFTITIVKITELTGLDKQTFINQCGKMIKMELRKDKQKSLKITKNNLFRLFPNKAVV